MSQKISLLNDIQGESWISWTPTFANVVIGNGTLVGKYIQIGKTIFGRVSFTLGSTSSVSGDITLNLPVTAATYAGTGTLTPIGTAHFFNATTIFTGSCDISTTTTAALRPFGVGATSNTMLAASATVPFTWANTHQFDAQFTYEAA